MTAPTGSVEAPSFTDVFLVKVGVRLPGSWDPTVPVLSQCLTRVWLFSTATRLRRFTVLPLTIHLALTLLALIFPASAHAALMPAGAILAMLTVTDSYGVPLSQYAFSTDYGNILDGGSQALFLAYPLQVEAAVFVIIGGFAIWLLIWILDFGLLTVLVEPIALAVQSYASQVFPGVATIAAIIAALVIASLVIRGDTPKAVGLTATALVVAVLAGFVAYSPISWAVSEDGPIMQGRDLAIAAATNSEAGSGQTYDRLAQLEGMLATNLVRGPLQIWNFGDRPDETPACAAAWSSGVKSGDADRIKDGVEDCGSPNSRSMKASADNPNGGQVANGFFLIVLILWFLIYAIIVAYRVTIEFARCVMSAFKLLWGLAVGFIPGPGQRSIYTSAVELGYSAVAMFGYVTITMFAGELFITQFRRLDNFVVAQFSAIVLMWIAAWMTLRLGRKRDETISSITDGILNELGATKEPQGGGGGGNAKSLYRPGGFLYNEPRHGVGTAMAFGIGGTLAGEALYKASPNIAMVTRRFASFYPAGPMQTLYRGLDDASTAKAAADRDKKTEDVATTVGRINRAVGQRGGGGPNPQPPSRSGPGRPNPNGPSPNGPGGPSPNGPGGGQPTGGAPNPNGPNGGQPPATGTPGSAPIPGPGVGPPQTPANGQPGATPPGGRPPHPAPNGQPGATPPAIGTPGAAPPTPLGGDRPGSHESPAPREPRVPREPPTPQGPMPPRPR